VSYQLEGRLARMLTIGTWASVVALVAGSVVALIAGAGSDGSSTPEAVLWLGIGLVVLTPIARVALAAVGFWRGSERELAAIAIAVLCVLGVTVVAGIGG
jgi:uncharacterized membrane protein